MTRQLTNKLIERGYKAKEIKLSINKIQFNKRHEELHNKPTKPKEAPPLILPTKYSEISPTIQMAVNKNWPLIHENQQLSTLFPTKPMLAHKKNKSLSNILVRSKISEPIQLRTPQSRNTNKQDPEPEVHTNLDQILPKKTAMRKCDKKDCSICPRMRVGKTIYNRVCYINVPIPKYKIPLTCWSKRVVYAVKCANCHETYIGQTLRPLRTRITEHIDTVKRKTNHHMSHHFNKSCGLNSLQFTPLQKVDDSLHVLTAEKQLQHLETLWIRRLSTLQPWGMNYVEVETESRLTKKTLMHKLTLS